MPQTWTIRRATAPRRRDLLEKLFAHRERGMGFVVSLLESEQRGTVSLECLFEARQDHQLHGAAFAQVLPGGCAIVERLWMQEPSPELQEQLWRALEDDLKNRTRVLQALPKADEPERMRWLKQKGFRPANELLLMQGGSQNEPPPPPAGMCFQPYQGDADRLLRLLERTYRNSLDFPQLNGVLSAAQSLDGHQSIGESGSKYWRFLQCEGQDAGCLLVADHPGLQSCEVVYMGVAPEFRGRGLGRLLLRQAQHLTSLAQRTCLTLGVDSGNQPAIAVYSSGGFEVWDRFSVFLKVL